jgi:hypothetical protein
MKNGIVQVEVGLFAHFYPEVTLRARSRHSNEPYFLEKAALSNQGTTSYV